MTRRAVVLPRGRGRWAAADGIAASRSVPFGCLTCFAKVELLHFSERLGQNSDEHCRLVRYSSSTPSSCLDLSGDIPRSPEPHFRVCLGTYADISFRQQFTSVSTCLHVCEGAQTRRALDARALTKFHVQLGRASVATVARAAHVVQEVGRESRALHPDAAARVGLSLLIHELGQTQMAVPPIPSLLQLPPSAFSARV